MHSIGIHPSLQGNYSAIQALQLAHNLKAVSGIFMHLVKADGPAKVVPIRKAVKVFNRPFDGGDAA